MASKAELREQAEALGRELGVSVDTAGLNFDGLTKLVEGLQAQRPGVAPAPAQVEPPRPVEVVNTPAPVARPAVAAQPAPARPVNGADDGALGGPPPRGKRREPPKVPYYVAKGRSIVCARGSIDEYQEIKARDLGLATPEACASQLAHLIERGIVVKTGA